MPSNERPAPSKSGTGQSVWGDAGKSNRPPQERKQCLLCGCWYDRTEATEGGWSMAGICGDCEVNREGGR
jgi:hypothetical protein